MSINNYFNIDINELYNDINKIFDKWRRNNNFCGFIKYFDSLRTGCELYSSITGFDISEKHFLTNEMVSKMKKYDNNMVKEFFDYSLSQMDFWCECFSSYDRIVEDNNLYNVYDYALRKTFSKDECIDIVKSFYSELGKYNNIINKMFDNNYIIDDVDFNDKDFLGSSHILNCIDKNYIAIGKMNKDILFLSVLVHEFGHIIDYELYNNNTYFSFRRSYMQEVAPTFFQLMFNDFLKKNKIASDEVDLLLCSRILENYDNMGMFETCGKFKLESMSLGGDVFCNGEDGTIYKFPFYDTLIYTLSFYYAFHLKYLYYNDKDNFDNVFSYFMKNKGEVSGEDLALALGFGNGVFESGVLIEEYIKEPFINLRKKLIK